MCVPLAIITSEIVPHSGRLSKLKPYQYTIKSSVLDKTKHSSYTEYHKLIHNGIITIVFRNSNGNSIEFRDDCCNFIYN